MSDDHGYSRYTRGCRCGTCRQAKCEYMRARRASARETARRFTDDSGRHYVPGITHGRFGYMERGCRCRFCTAAMATESVGRHRRRRMEVAS